MPSLVGPRQGHLAPGALHPFPHLPRSLALWSLPSRTLASSHPLLRPLSSTFSHLPPFGLFSFSSPFISSLISSPNSSISRVSRSNRSQENSEKFYLTFPPFQCYFDFAFRLGFLRFSLLISIVSQVSLLRSKSCLLTFSPFFYLGSFSISIQGELAQVANFI